ncbi:MAG: NifU family protein [Bacteroidetes bacterium]|nr:MAG: NifU family protein [Bacteroidota bacterium]
MDQLQQIELKENILKSLDKVRPYLNADGGDIELVNISVKKIVTVKLTGACSDCPHHYQTLAGVEEVIKKNAPSVSQVVSIDEREDISD